MVDNIGRLRELCNSGNPKPLSDFLTSFADGDDIQWIVDAAEQGDSNAQFVLSEYYLSGENKEQAFPWALKSAQQGNSWGENNLAYCYQHGYGVEQNENLALEWYKKSAAQGNTSGLSNVGYCYSNGIGTDKDDDAAFQCYLKSAELGNPNSQNKVGDLYCEGLGTDINVNAAIEWYEKAAANWVEDALLSLLLIYWGIRFGIRYRNLQVAAKKLEDFYNNQPDDETIQYFMAFVYYFGIGTKADKDRAKAVWPPLEVILSDEVNFPLGIKEMGFFYIFGIVFICQDNGFRCECPIVNELLSPSLLSFSKAIQNSSYASHHLLMESNGIYYKKGVRTGEFYQLLKSYDQDPWDVLQYASPCIREQLCEYLQNDQEEEFRKLIATENSDLMARFRAYCQFRELVDLPKLLGEANGESLEKATTEITESPEKINFMRERLMQFDDLNEPVELIDYGIDSVLLVLGEVLMYGDTANEASSVLKPEDVRRLRQLIGQEKYKDIFDFTREYLFDTTNGEEEVEEESFTPVPQDEEISADSETANPDYPVALRKGRLRISKLQDIVCKKYLQQWFANKIEDVPYISYVFFGHGREPKEKLVFTKSKAELTIFVLFLTRGYGKSEVWSYFNNYVVDKNGKPIFAKNPRSTIKENLLVVEDRTRREITKLFIPNKLSKEEEEDLK